MNHSTALHRSLFFLCLVFLYSIVIAPLATPAWAEPGAGSSKKGLSGNIQVGVIWANSTDQLMVNDDNKKTDTLSNESDSYDLVSGILLFDLKYTLKDDTTLYIATPIDEYGIRLSSGFTRNLGNPGRLDVSLFWKPLHQAWQDPYIANVERDETDVMDCGVEIKYNSIMGTGLLLQGRYNYIDVDKDLIGDRINELQRDGALHTAGLGYKFQLNRANTIIPVIDYTRAEMDGDSNSYNKYRIILNYMRMTSKYMLNAYIVTGATKYAKEHPLYGKTRDEKSTGGFAIFTWLKPFDLNRVFFNVGAGAGYADANINFFDKRSYTGYMAVGYNF